MAIRGHLSSLVLQSTRSGGTRGPPLCDVAAGRMTSDRFVMDENGTHWRRPATDPAGLDVERLARAINDGLVFTEAGHSIDEEIYGANLGDATTARAIATAIAAEYARLAIADGRGPA